LLAVSFLLFNSAASGANSALLYVPLPFLLWAAVRFKALGATGAIAVVTLVVIVGVTGGHGPFSEKSAMQNVLSVQVFLISMSMPLLFLAGIIEEREETEETLREREERIGLAAESANSRSGRSIFGVVNRG
jgi:integral membrane sensor domain MASE1